MLYRFANLVLFANFCIAVVFVIRIHTENCFSFFVYIGCEGFILYSVTLLVLFKS